MTAEQNHAELIRPVAKQLCRLIPNSSCVMDSQWKNKDPCDFDNCTVMRKVYQAFLRLSI